MGKSITKLSDENFKTYTKMVKYIRNLKMLDIHKREITQKLYNMYTNLTSKEVNLEDYIVNPKIFCDTICEGYLDNTPIYMVYLETIKKFTLVISVICLFCDVVLKKSMVNKYFVYILIGTFVVSILLTYLKLYRTRKYGLDEESLGYKILYNIVGIIMVVPIFLVKDVIRLNENISILNIGIICIFAFFISTMITHIHKNRIKEKINCKSII